MTNIEQLESVYQMAGVRVPADRSLDRYGSDDVSVLELEKQVREARAELFSKRAIQLTRMIEQVSVDSPGQSGAPQL